MDENNVIVPAKNNSKVNTVLLVILIILALGIIWILWHMRKAEEAKDAQQNNLPTIETGAIEIN